MIKGAQINKEKSRLLTIIHYASDLPEEKKIKTLV